MKVLIVPSWYNTSYKPISGIFFKEQAEALQRFGHEVIVAFPELWSLKTIGRNKGVPGVSFMNEGSLPTYRYKGYHFLPRVPYAFGLLYYSRLEKIYSVIIQKYGKPDIIHAHSCLWAGYAAIKLGKKYNVPVVVTEHSSAFIRGSIKSFEYRVIRKILNSADAVIAVSPVLQKKMVQILKREILVLPNIVNVSDFFIEEKPQTDTFTFFSLATLRKNKGFDVLFQAMAKIKDDSIRLVIGGDGKERGAYRKMVEDLGIGHKVSFVGHIPRHKVREYINQSDVFVLPSRYETFGVVYVESLACGKPVIATACGGPELIVNEKNGYIVPVDDINALTEAMLQIRKNYKKFNADLIRQDCIDRFSEENIIKKIEAVYQKVVHL